MSFEWKSEDDLLVGFQLQATWLLSELRGAAHRGERRCFDPNQLQRKQY
jgi:hypothetical protein